MRQEKIRPIAICVCRHGDRILVAEGHDRRKNRTFYRPLGGTIEFGEPAADTVRREFREEIQSDLDEVRYLGTLENIFVYEGRRSHEIVLVFDGELADKSLYQKEVIQGDEFGMKFKAVWKRLEEFDAGRPPLYPEGLPALLQAGK